MSRCTDEQVSQVARDENIGGRRIWLVVQFERRQLLRGVGGEAASVPAALSSSQVSGLPGHLVPPGRYGRPGPCLLLALPFMAMCCVLPLPAFGGQQFLKKLCISEAEREGGGENFQSPGLLPKCSNWLTLDWAESGIGQLSPGLPC